MNVTTKMSLSIGQIVKGRTASYRLVEALKSPTVFKAQVLPNSTFKSPFAVVKTELGSEKVCLKREHSNYMLPSIASNQYIRKLYDVVTSADSDDTDEVATSDPFCLVFEWMDHDLRTVPSQKFRENAILPKATSKSILSAIAHLKKDFNAIHTDINPNNIFLSHIDEPSPVVKLGDLGNTLMEGYDKIRVQSLPTRAPEVWRGLGCWHSSDVWSVAVTLAHGLSPFIVFGARDKMVQDLTEAWCIGKVQRLVGKFGPPITNPEYEEEFLVAEHLESTTFVHPDTQMETQFIKTGTIREELGKLRNPTVPSDLLDFIDYLLITDHTRRPTASEALQHPYLQGLL